MYSTIGTLARVNSSLSASPETLVKLRVFSLPPAVGEGWGGKGWMKSIDMLMSWSIMGMVAANPLESRPNDGRQTGYGAEAVPGEYLALAWLAGVWGQPRPQRGMISHTLDVGEMPWVAS
jgi:hypothetical protein